MRSISAGSWQGGARPDRHRYGDGDCAGRRAAGIGTGARRPESATVAGAVTAPGDGGNGLSTSGGGARCWGGMSISIRKGASFSARMRQQAGCAAVRPTRYGGTEANKAVS